MVLDSFSYTGKGGRAYNQDSVGISEVPSGAVFVVADGLGGHLHGEMASQCAVDMFSCAADIPADDQKGWLEEQIGRINRQIISLQEQHGNMRTTVVALAVQENRAAWAHVGDSRLYYLHDRRIEAVTEDHSVAYKKYLAGEITREEIASDVDQSCLLRALGNPTRSKPDSFEPEHPIAPGDGFLLCSDGFWEYVLDEEILVDYLKADCAQAWAELLLLRVMERIDAGNDNLSVITVLVKEEQQEASE